MVGREQRGPQAPSPLSLSRAQKQQNGPRTQRAAGSSFINRHGYFWSLSHVAEPGTKRVVDDYRN